MSVKCPDFVQPYFFYFNMTLKLGQFTDFRRSFQPQVDFRLLANIKMKKKPYRWITIRVGVAVVTVNRIPSIPSG